MKDTRKELLLSLLTLLTVSLYPCLFQYSTNLPESRFKDTLVFLGIFLVVGVLMFLVLLPVFRRPAPAGFLSTLGLLVFINFGLVKSAIHKHYLLPGVILLGAFGLLLGVLGVWILRKKKGCQVPLILLCLMFSGLCLVSGFLAVPTLVKNLVTRETAEAEAVATTDSRPNVYYYIYDEYAGQEGLDYFYGYDNSGFMNELRSRGFSCSDSSYNTSSCATVSLVPSLYDLSHQPEVWFEHGDGSMPRIYRLFRDMGYKINLISHSDFLDRDGAVSLAHHQSAASVAEYLYRNSILPNTPLSASLEQLPTLRLSYQYEALLQECFTLLETAPEYTGPEPTLTLGYIQSPHTLFLYDGEGNMNPEEDTQNWADPKFYLGQLQYTNGRILAAVDNILREDPTAVIILQSDHGARLGYHMAELYGAPYDPETETIYQQNILNCVYLGDSAPDITGLSGTNTLRLVLNRIYGMDYEMLIDPTGFVNYYP